MTNLNALKSRIKGVKSTQKITRAMRMVSAAKLKRAKDIVDAAKCYIEEIHYVMKQLLNSNISDGDAKDLLHGKKSNEKPKCLLVIITSDKGLCGSFNSSVIKEAKKQISKLESSGTSVKLYLIGKKAYDAFSGIFSNKILDYKVGFSSKSVDFSDVVLITKKIIDTYLAGTINSCKIIYNFSESTLKQVVVTRNLLPLNSIRNYAHIEGNSSYDFEPEEVVILQYLIPKSISAIMYNYLLESYAGEYAARMASMENATNNAGEMIKLLTLQYNRTRQAVITKELIEIISGAEAL